ncbi:MAG: hypothetical protein IPO62_07280 [Saprospiraceae bacterium]|nr:hypothetical protein [Saprospiraceae bacterium]
MQTLHSHTHCQGAQANAKTEAWQRVCLSNRISKTTDKPSEEEEHRTFNTDLQKWRFSAPQIHLLFIKHWFSESTFVVKIATFVLPSINKAST